MKKEDLVKLAFVAHPHGIKGEAEIRLINDNPEESILDDEMKVWLFPSSPKSKIKTTGEEWTIAKIRFGNKVICQFEGIKDRTHLESLIPFEIYLDRESFPEPEDDEIYLVDLVDMDVVNQEGVKVGKLESFSDNGMQYLFDVRMDTGEVVTLPYVDAFFPEIDMEEKKITMIMPEYTE
ncbi:ribosome maturation factor RimM [Peredibacter starrii]|uniref:Ribosome maturation factor RimM n=1 Tax=Peredibacter starrii TaxID=28202 RepID=A0AAX4HKR2_9BACT|nr:ribosome maturation factor RimM [Peredibacter starrii]WPU63767.1 ribosome maturation factor RimM [Peredibacter starrii]